MQTTQSTRSPLWLRGLGALALVAIGAAALYAVAIGIENFSRIGV